MATLFYNIKSSDT